MNITWLGQGGYLIEQAGQRLAVDPYLTDSLAVQQGLRRLSPPPVSIAELMPDAIFITHDHLDHFDWETLEPLLRQSPECPLLGPQSVVDHAQRMGLDERRLVLAQRDESLRLLGFILTPTPAKHGDPFAVGLLVEAGGRLIYISGDTLCDSMLAPQIRSLAGRPLDATFVCINGQFGNMSSLEAAEFVASLKPAVAVPMHYGMFAENTADPQEFIAACLARNQNTRLWEMGSSVRL